MTRRELNDYCLTLPAAYEEYPFDNEAAHSDNGAWTVMRHRTNKKGFAHIYERNGKLCINLKCDLFVADFLRQAYEDVTPGWHMNKVHWNTVTLGEMEICGTNMWFADEAEPFVKGDSVKLSAKVPTGKEATAIFDALCVGGTVALPPTETFYFGQHFQFMDMEAAYDCPAFSWSTSFLVTCADTAEYDALFNALTDGGTVMMQEENFMPYRKVAWVTDKFGVTWQPVLE